MPFAYLILWRILCNPIPYVYMRVEIVICLTFLKIRLPLVLLCLVTRTRDVALIELKDPNYQ